MLYRHLLFQVIKQSAGVLISRLEWLLKVSAATVLMLCSAPVQHVLFTVLPSH
jgi:hypothetical protein